ncbi:uncharacterized protein LOC128883210 [Hylaeus volcanicus]|uniref:uncharacterized protein LOC128883210 n=1 Tax=Hylaeus volcanicus TaxID=313075 RepID=UPI0023B7D287|nr:uncharacterized protein LOC128883210 [Hylaeus volcanicus]
MTKSSENMEYTANHFIPSKMCTLETCQEKEEVNKADFQFNNSTNDLSELSTLSEDKNTSVNPIERVHVIPVPQIKHVTRTVFIPKIVSKNTEKSTFQIPTCEIFSNTKMFFQKESSIRKERPLARALSPPLFVTSKDVFFKERNKEKGFDQKCINRLAPLKVFYKVKHAPKLKNVDGCIGFSKKTHSSPSLMSPCPTTFSPNPSKVTSFSLSQQLSTANRVNHMNVAISSHPVYVPFQPKDPVSVIDLTSCSTKIVHKPCEKFTGPTFRISYPQVDLVCSTDHDCTSKNTTREHPVDKTLFKRGQTSIQYDPVPEIRINSSIQQNTVEESHSPSNRIQENVQDPSPRLFNTKSIFEHKGVPPPVLNSVDSINKTRSDEKYVFENVSAPRPQSSFVNNVIFKEQPFQKSVEKIQPFQKSAEKIQPFYKNTENLRVGFHHTVGFSSHTPTYLWKVASQLLEKKKIQSFS